MLDWLKQDPRTPPSVTVGERVLPIVIRRHPTARRMIMRLSQDGSEVRMTIPRWGRTADAVAFARSRSDWLAARHADIPAPTPLEAGGMLDWRGQRLEIEHRPEAPRTPVAKDGAIVVGGPANLLPARLRRWLEAQARLHLAEDLAFYCARAGVPAPRLALSNAQRRWGSCAHDGSIRINWRLIMAPDFVRRSVVAHEVSHLVHFDHGPQFHALLRDLFEGDIDAANRWLRDRGRGLYLPFG